MTRSRRLHTSGALHYLVLRGNVARELFPQVADFPAFELLVVRQLAACRIELLAFCWLRDAAHFALRVDAAPLGDFVQQVAGSHARRINRRAGVRGHLFRQRYRTAVVADTQLPAVVSHLHLLPVRAGLAADPAGYAWSSHLCYLGLQPLEWVSTSRVLAALEALERLEDRTDRERPARAEDRGNRESPGRSGHPRGGRLEVYRRFMEREIAKYEA
ncbi:MAG: transposase, partial [Steroidobacteraceae bacterium]